MNKNNSMIVLCLAILPLCPTDIVSSDTASRNHPPHEENATEVPKEKEWQLVEYRRGMPCLAPFSRSFCNVFKIIGDRHDIKKTMHVNARQRLIAVYGKPGYYQLAIARADGTKAPEGRIFGFYVQEHGGKETHAPPSMTIRYFEQIAGITAWNRKYRDKHIPLPPGKKVSNETHDEAGEEAWQYQLQAEWDPQAEKAGQYRLVERGHRCFLFTAIHELGHAFMVEKYLPGSLFAIHLLDYYYDGAARYNPPAGSEALPDFRERLFKISLAGIAATAVVFGYEDPWLRGLTPATFEEKRARAAYKMRAQLQRTDYEEMAFYAMKEVIRRFSKQADFATRKEEYAIRLLQDEYRRLQEELRPYGKVLKMLSYPVYQYRTVEKDSFQQLLSAAIEQGAEAEWGRYWQAERDRRLQEIAWYQRQQGRMTEEERIQKEKTQREIQRNQAEAERRREEERQRREQQQAEEERRTKEWQRREEERRYWEDYRRRENEYYHRLAQERQEEELRSTQREEQKRHQQQDRREEYRGFVKEYQQQWASYVRKKARHPQTPVDLNKEFCEAFSSVPQRCALRIEEARFFSLQPTDPAGWANAEEALSPETKRHLDQLGPFGYRPAKIEWFARDRILRFTRQGDYIPYKELQYSEGKWLWVK